MKNHFRNSLCLLLGLFGFKSLPALAAQDMFLCSDGFQGESQDKDYAGCVDVLAWSWGLSNSGTTHDPTGGGAGKANFQDISVTKWIDKSSPILMLQTATGKHFPNLELFVRSACSVECVSQPYYTLTMTDVLVSSVSTGGSGGEDRLTENVSFNFAKVEWCYSETLKEGNLGTPICYRWDIAAAQPY